MKTIKVKYVGFWEDFDPKQATFTQLIAKHYNIVECDDPDYIICSMFGRTRYEFCRYPQVRIFYSLENYVPNFNVVDYGVSSYHLQLGDRHAYCPICIDPYHRSEELAHRKKHFTKEDLQQKPHFANFIASHESEHNIRGDFFKKLCEYKKILSAGSYLNNMPNGETVSWTDNSKFNLQKQCKFTLCFESTQHSDFITEKITDAFYADTVPIYFGSTDASEIFNPKAFIDCSKFDSFEAAIERIKEIDSNDDLYLQMLNEPVFKDENFVENTLKNLEDFICHIFEQPLEQAYRRSRVYWPKSEERCVLRDMKLFERVQNGDILEDSELQSVFTAKKRSIRQARFRHYKETLLQLPKRLFPKR